MAKVIKHQGEVVAEFIHVARPAGTLPQTATQNIFQVRGGRVLVRGVLGEVTVILQNSDAVPKVTAAAYDSAGVIVGTAVDVASTVASTSREVGGKFWVEGDGTALVASNAGAAFIGANSGCWICPQGYVQFITGASKTGSIKWDLWYQPLDEGADVIAVPLNAGV